MMNGLPELARRLAELDAEPGTLPMATGPSTDFMSAVVLDNKEPLKIVYGASARTDFIRAIVFNQPETPRVARGACDDVDQFIGVMARVTDTSITGTNSTSDISILPYVSAAAADALVNTSSLLARLADAVPEIVTGPLRLDRQYWVGTPKPGYLPQRELTLREAHFVGVSDAMPIKASTKPFDLGLFTATGVLGTYGMWRMYLKSYESSGPFPWHTWIVEPHSNAVVREIASASQWVDFVLSHPRREGELLFPDWHSVARHCDGIHMTLRAIAATQGLYFPTEQGIVAAPFFDVESTFWLRWCFRSVKLVETVE